MSSGEHPGPATTTLPQSIREALIAHARAAEPEKISTRSTEPKPRTGHRAADDPRFSEFLDEE